MLRSVCAGRLSRSAVPDNLVSMAKDRALITSPSCAHLVQGVLLALTLTVWPSAALAVPPGLDPAGPASPPRARIPVTRLSAPVVLDGLSHDSAWELVEPLAFVQLAPAAGSPPTERTELLLGYDDRYLYVAGRLFDREPGKIQSTTKRRDAETASAEWFGIVIDSYNDKENALAFFTTPAGLRWDAAVLNDGNPPPDPLNVAWNTDWEVATARTDDGWFAEFRIPLANLRFQESDGQVVMGVISWRLIARKNEVVVYPAIPDTWGLSGRFKPSQAQEVVFEGIASQKPLYATPYVVGGIRRGDLDGAGSQAREIGLDAKYGITNNLTLDLTVNPDFAQVEADDVQMNVSRFALFYPEKRPFFQERSAIFDFSFGGSDALFYSRRVGLDGGEPVRIVGGARLVGRASGWDVGVLNMQTAATPTDGGVNIGVARVRRQVLNPFSYVGGMVTSRISQRGTDNVAYGLDSLLRLTKHDYLQVAWARTAAPGAGPWFSNDSSRGRLYLERRVMTGLAYRAEFGYAGRSYHPALGFESRRDFTNAAGALLYGWVPSGSSSILLHRVAVDGWALRSNSRGVIESSETGPYWATRTKSGYLVMASPRLSSEDLEGGLGLAPGVTIPAGRYDFAHLYAYLATPPTRLVSAEMNVDAGRFYDGRRISASVSPRWQPLQDVELMGSYQLERITFPTRGEELTSHISRIRLSYMPTTALSVSVVVQHVNLHDSLGANFRVRYNPREGVDLWLVYDHTGSSIADGLPPSRTPYSQNSTFLVKYTHALRTTVGR